MGLISKIEDKLSGSSHDKGGAESKLEKQAIKHEMSSGSGTQSSKLNPIQNPIQSQAGQGAHAPGESGIGGSQSNRHGAHVPGESGIDGSHSNRHGAYGGQSSGTDQFHPSEREFRDNDGYGSGAQQGGRYSNDETRGPRQPFDPYSSRGQQTAASARPQDQEYGRRPVDDPNVPRSRTGGVRNSADELNDGSYGSHSRENRDAIPTAGGQKVGSDPYGSSSGTGGQQHHYGRDAALAGGAGAAGAGAYEMGHDRHQGRGDTGPASKTIGPHSNNMANIADPRVQPQKEKMHDHTTSGPHRSDMANKMDRRVEADPRRAQEKEGHHYGRDAALAGGAGAGAYELGKDRHHGHERDERGPVGSAYSTDDPSSRHGHGHHHHQQQQYDAGQSAANDQSYGSSDRRRGNNDDVSYMNRPTPGTQLDDQTSGNKYHYGRDAALVGGVGGAGALAEEKHHHHHQQQQQQQQQQAPGGYDNDVSSTQHTGGSGNDGTTSGGVPTERKLGGAYEAGYRDAMAHVQAEMKKTQL